MLVTLNGWVYGSSMPLFRLRFDLTGKQIAQLKDRVLRDTVLRGALVSQGPVEDPEAVEVVVSESGGAAVGVSQPTETEKYLQGVEDGEVPAPASVKRPRKKGSGKKK